MNKEFIDLINAVDIKKNSIIGRHLTHKVQVGKISIGGGSPIVVQSMTNTNTADIDATVKQIIELHQAGSEIVRVTVNNEEAADAVEKIYSQLLKKNYDIPIAGCFHYNGHALLEKYPGCAQALSKYRINPGNVGFGEKRDKQFEQMINIAIKNNKPVRIGVNWGSLDQDLLSFLMESNNGKSSDEILYDALVLSCLISAEKAKSWGLVEDKIILSCKTSRVQDLIIVYEALAKRCNYALHLGLTEAGMGTKGIVATAAALGVLLQKGIGDTIRASLTPYPGGSRTEEVAVCLSVLQALDLRSFAPEVSACPGCGRTTSTYFQYLSQEVDSYIKLNMPSWKQKYPGVEKLKIAVMGCIVNGPGESKHADIGISLPGTGENKVAPVFIEGEKAHTLRGDNIVADFIAILNDYIDRRFS